MLVVSHFNIVIRGCNLTEATWDFLVTQLATLYDVPTVYQHILSFKAAVYTALQEKDKARTLMLSKLTQNISISRLLLKFLDAAEASALKEKLPRSTSNQ